MDTKELRAEIAKATLPSGRRRIGAELRAKLKSAASLMREAGASQTQIAESLGISHVTVSRYLRSKHEKPVAVRPVSVGAKAAVGSKVMTPSGFEVEGLDVDDIVTLIRSLS